MRAVVHREYGDPRDLRVVELPVPEVRPAQVLLRIHAASVHADVWHTVVGQPYVLRLMGNGVRRPRRRIPGTDASGVVEAVGPDVVTLSPGDRVFGEIVDGIQWHNGGAFAEFAAVKAAKLRLMPDNLDFLEAAAMPTSALIALRALRTEGRVEAGDRVLINGAGGGVGMFLVQLAKAVGVEHVTAVDTGDRLELARSLGADEVLDYRIVDYTARPGQYDAVIDVPGNHPFSRVRRIIRPDGRYVLIGHDQYGTVGRRVLGSMPTAIGLMGRSLWTSQLSKPYFGQYEDGMGELAWFAAQGILRAPIDRTFPLEEAGDAILHLAAGRGVGKVVLQIAPTDGAS